MSKITWVQHPVGHGGFHTGYAVSEDCEPFLWIFDCGSRAVKGVSKALARELKAWGGRTPERIDWMFISHFDFDHVSGLETLFNLKDVTNVMLPYVNEAELAHVLCESVADRAPPPWYADFIADPAGWLAGQGAARIIFLNGRGPADERFEGFPDRGPTPEGDWKVRITPEPQPMAPDLGLPDTSVEVIPGGECDIAASNGQITLRLKPYRAPIDPFGHLFLLSALESIVGGAPAGGRRPGLGEFAKAIAKTAATTKGRKAIQAALALAVGSSNRSSLSLLSVPEIYGPSWTAGWALRRGPAFYEDWDDNLSPPAWLNTGDAELRAHADLSDWARTYSPDMDAVRVLALPHHGSDHNSEAGLTGLNPRALLTAHVGDKAKKHPGPNTAANAGGRLVKVTEKPETWLSMHFRVWA